MILHDPVINKRGNHRQVDTKSIVKALADDVVQDCQIFLTHMRTVMTVEGISPVLLHGAYQAMTAYDSSSPEASSNDAEVLDILEEKLILLGHRWNAAGLCHSYFDKPLLSNCS